MEISQLDLLFLCLAAFSCGAILGIVYDVTSLLPMLGGKTFQKELRKNLSDITLPLIKRKLKTRIINNNITEFSIGFSVFVHDLVFMAFSGILTSMLVYRFNDGIWRLYVFAFEILGFCIYRVTVRQLVLKIVEYLRFLVKSVFLYLYCFLILPLKNIFCVLFRAYKKQRLIRNINKYSKKKKKEIKAFAICSGCLKTDR